MTDIMARFVSDDRATVAVEYAVIGGLISIAIIAGGLAIGKELAADFTGVAKDLK